MKSGWQKYADYGKHGPVFYRRRVEGPGQVYAKALVEVRHNGPRTASARVDFIQRYPGGQCVVYSFHRWFISRAAAHQAFGWANRLLRSLPTSVWRWETREEQK